MKLCFVIMGFGKKTDYSTGKVFNLDKTYQNIIKPAVVSLGYECVRADEIQDSGLIDKSMYALLVHSELVIADISTFNPNAIYELGIRHAVRPFSTIILKEEIGSIPFDLNHSRIFSYKHLGDDIGVDESKRCQTHLTQLIKELERTRAVDSPMYEYLSIVPPTIPPELVAEVVKELAEKEKHIFAICEQARIHMGASNFADAIKLWKRAKNLLPNDTYVTQQLVLATYKSKAPTELSSLTEALTILNELNPEGDTTDPETLGLCGAIYKRLHQLTDDIGYLESSENAYRKGFELTGDYYTGENYAMCLELKSAASGSPEEKAYYLFHANTIRKRILAILGALDPADIEARSDRKWVYATLANCSFYLGLTEDHKRYESHFIKSAPAKWEKETYFASYEVINKLRSK